MEIFFSFPVGSISGLEEKGAKSKYNFAFAANVVLNIVLTTQQQQYWLTRPIAANANSSLVRYFIDVRSSLVRPLNVHFSKTQTFFARGRNIFQKTSNQMSNVKVSVNQIKQVGVFDDK